MVYDLRGPFDCVLFFLCEGLARLDDAWRGCKVLDLTGALLILLGGNGMAEEAGLGYFSMASRSRSWIS